jgi:hypothetical protein
MLKKLFKYIEPLWLGNDEKISLRRLFAIIFSIDLILNIHQVIFNYEPGMSYADTALLLGIEAGLITAFLSMTTISSIRNAEQNPANTNLPA